MEPRVAAELQRLFADDAGDTNLAVARAAPRAIADDWLAAGSLFDDLRPLHWALEFPEVRGFDAIVGNPPFQGGQKITGALGTSYRDFLVEWVADGVRGSADLVAYFFLRAKRPAAVRRRLWTNRHQHSGAG